MKQTLGIVAAIAICATMAVASEPQPRRETMLYLDCTDRCKPCDTVKAELARMGVECVLSRSESQADVFPTSYAKSPSGAISEAVGDSVIIGNLRAGKYQFRRNQSGKPYVEVRKWAGW